MHDLVRMYDKFGRVLRLETTTNDVSFFKHHGRANIATVTPAASWPAEEVEQEGATAKP